MWRSTVKKISGLLLWIVSTFISQAQPVVDGEREFVIGLLNASTQNLLTNIEGVNDDQWSFKSTPEAWSVGEIAEHITLAEDLLLSIALKALQAPADVSKAESLDGREKFILEIIEDRSRKSQAPEVIRPSDKFSQKQEIIDAFENVREKTINYLNTTQAPLKNHVAFHPFIGDMTVYQWFVFIAGHTNRHVAQLLEVKAHANYPKL